ncbi:hypothetical protein Y032_0156g3119 [Ancylostoma ceylanicum]|uniref:Uncharacterized protein n=1 Tax=Ancylostoma ceylanicum TaxID=53326 RepID=A0A016SZ36_9BILA|nr:hypothetical protein Y032_0156g3119 [Ancylostoma ceylanicum]
MVCCGSESTSCRNRQLSTADSRPDYEKTLGLKSPARKRLDQSCVGRLTSAPCPNAALIRRPETIADSPDFKPYTRRPKRLGISMLLLSLLVAIMDFSMLFSFMSVLGNALQINVNEMPWHRCSSRGDGPGCRSIASCNERYEQDIYAEDSPLISTQELSEDLNDANTWNLRLKTKSFADQCIRSELSAIYRLSQEDKQQYLSYVGTQRSVPMLSFLLNKVGVDNYNGLAFGFPSASDILLHFLSWVLIIAISMQGRSFLLKEGDVFWDKIHLSEACIHFFAVFSTVMDSVLNIELCSPNETGSSLAVGSRFCSRTKIFCRSVRLSTTWSSNGSKARSGTGYMLHEQDRRAYSVTISTNVLPLHRRLLYCDFYAGRNG